jgi:hypothetical protein
MSGVQDRFRLNPYQISNSVRLARENGARLKAQKNPPKPDISAGTVMRHLKPEPMQVSLLDFVKTVQ